MDAHSPNRAGYFERGALGEMLAGVTRYKHHRFSKTPPDFGQPATDREWTVHAHDNIVEYLCAHGYGLKVAREAVDLLCTRLEAFLWEGHAKSLFRPYRVWVVDMQHADAPHIRASRGLLQGHHLVLTPQVPTMGGASYMRGLGSGRQLRFDATGIPQLAPDGKLAGTSTRARSLESDNFHRVTAANPVFSLLNVPPPDPSPLKAPSFFFLDLWTLDSAPLAPQRAESTWRFSWSADPSRYPPGVQRALGGLPGGSFLVPTHKDDQVVTASRLDKDEVIQGIAVVFEAHANDPVARPSSAHAVEHVARAHPERREGSEASGFDVGRSKTCVVM
ncbi:hypothetical protein JCM8208_007807 [Rhodotorula glutinis]